MPFTVIQTIPARYAAKNPPAATIEISSYNSRIFIKLNLITVYSYYAKIQVLFNKYVSAHLCIMHKFMIGIIKIQNLKKCINEIMNYELKTHSKCVFE